LHFAFVIILIYDFAFLACKYTDFSSLTEIYQGISYKNYSFCLIFSQQMSG